MLGFPTKEIKEVAESANARLKQLEPTLQRLDFALGRADALLANLTAASEDVRAITAHFRKLVTGQADDAR